MIYLVLNFIAFLLVISKSLPQISAEINCEQLLQSANPGHGIDLDLFQSLTRNIMSSLPVDDNIIVSFGMDLGSDAKCFTEGGDLCALPTKQPGPNDAYSPRIATTELTDSQEKHGQQANHEATATTVSPAIKPNVTQWNEITKEAKSDKRRSFMAELEEESYHNESVLITNKSSSEVTWLHIVHPAAELVQRTGVSLEDIRPRDIKNSFEESEDETDCSSQQFWFEASNTRTYHMVVKSSNFSEAKGGCLGDGHLAYAGIRDKGIRSELKRWSGKLKKCGKYSGPIWVGLVKVNVGGAWEWLDGEATTTDEEFWGKGEPNNPKELCSHLKGGWKLNSIFCDRRLPNYLCEYDH